MHQLRLLPKGVLQGQLQTSALLGHLLEPLFQTREPQARLERGHDPSASRLRLRCDGRGERPGVLTRALGAGSLVQGNDRGGVVGGSIEGRDPGGLLPAPIGVPHDATHACCDRPHEHLTGLIPEYR